MASLCVPMQLDLAGGGFPVCGKDPLLDLVSAPLFQLGVIFGLSSACPAQF